MPSGTQQNMEKALEPLKINIGDFSDKLGEFFKKDCSEASQQHFYKVESSGTIEILEKGLDNLDGADLEILADEFTVTTKDR